MNLYGDYMEWYCRSDKSNFKCCVFFLPLSPFKQYWTALADNEVIQYMNWFIPVGEFIAITVTWLAAIAVFYAYQVILRWLKAISD